MYQWLENNGRRSNYRANDVSATPSCLSLPSVSVCITNLKSKLSEISCQVGDLSLTVFDECRNQTSAAAVFVPLLLHCCEGGHIHRLAVINDTGAWSLKKCKFMHEAEQNGPLCSAEAGWHFLKWCNVFSCVMISLSFFFTCRYSIQGKKRKQQMRLDSEIYSLSLQQVCWVEATIDVLGGFLRSVDILGSN